MIKEKYNVKKEEVSVNITNNVVDSIRFLKTDKTGFRVYDGNKIGISGIEGEYDENEMFEKAKANLDNNIEYLPKPTENVVESFVIDEVDISDKDFLTNIKTLIEKLHNKYPNIIFSNKINLSKKEYTIENDLGTNLKYSDKYYDFGLLFKEKQSGNIMDMIYEARFRDYDESKIIDDVSEMIDNYRKEATIQAGEQLVVIDFDYFAGKFASDLNSMIVMNGASLFSGKVGETVFSKDVTIYEDKNPDENFGRPFFDAEGIVNKDYRYKVIDEGKFVSPLVSKKEALMFNLPITGTANCSYDGVPGCSPSGFTVKKSGKTLKELLNGQKAVYVSVASGGDFTSSGDYASPVQLAYLIEDGKIVGKLDDITIAGNLFDMFGKNFVGRADDSILRAFKSCPLVLRMNIIK